jgi:ATP phosphoribosyltransferase regulatory subunit
MRLEPPVPEAVLKAVRAPFEAATGVWLDTAIAQPLGLYLDLAGEAMRERLFLVLGSGRQECCLRPDFTLGVALAHLASGAAGGRYLYEGPAFRVAPAGSGRAEQFLQIGLEVFGDGEAVGEDAAMMLTAWRAAAGGGRADLSLVLGDISLFGAFLAAVGVAAPTAQRLKAALASPARLARTLQGNETPPPGGRLAALLQGLGEDEAGAVLADIWALAGVEPVGGRSPAEIVHRLSTRSSAGADLTADQRALVERYLAISGHPEAALRAVAKLGDSDPGLQAALAGWERRLAAVVQIPADWVVFRTAFARGFGYYDGFLFEVRSAALGEDQPLAAGGRYDSLPARLGAPSTGGAVGCMVRPGRAWREGAA